LESISVHIRRHGGGEVFSSPAVGAVKDYRLCFETLASLIEEMPEAMLEGHFINGLKPDIRTEIRVLWLVSLEQIMELA